MISPLSTAANLRLFNHHCLTTWELLGHRCRITTSVDGFQLNFGFGINGGFLAVGSLIVWWWPEFVLYCSSGFDLGLIMVMGLRVGSLMVWVWILWWVWLPATKLMGLGGGVWLAWVCNELFVTMVFLLGRRRGFVAVKVLDNRCSSIRSYEDTG